MVLFEHLSDTLKNVLLHHVYSVYPQEACGLIFFDNRTQKLFIFPVVNIQNTLTGKDTDHIMFTMDNVFIDNIANKFFASSKYSLEAIYHSHTQNIPLFMSDADKQQAMADETVPHFPGISHIIFKVDKEKVKQVHTYMWRNLTKSFELIEDILF